MTLDPTTLRHIADRFDERGDLEAAQARDGCHARLVHATRAALLKELAADLRTYALHAAAGRTP